MLTQETTERRYMTTKETKKGRVFLIAQPTIPKDGKLPDLTPLAEWGEITVLVEAGQYPSFKPAEAWQRVLSRLENFDAENDFLCWAGGDTLAAVLCGSALRHLGHRAFRWLRFERARKEGGGRDNFTGSYTPVDIQLL